MLYKTFAILCCLCAMVAPASAQQGSTILVLDESGSMWAQLPEGRSRIEVARDVLGSFLAQRDASVPLGVVAYGHNWRGDCSDIETVAPVAVHDGAALGQRLRALMPRGKTPLADALRRAAAEIPATAEEADIVLVTDGLETCGGDPCAVAAELAAEGVPIRAHVVGFGLTEGEVRQIACVAETTGGLVLAPQSGAELADALIRTTQAVTRAPEQPGTAALNLSIAADSVGRPDAVTFRAVSEGGETRELGQLVFADVAALPVDLPAGNWLIVADAGDQGQGELAVTVEAGDNRTLYIPFTGILPSITLDQIGPYRAGASAIFPLRVLREGLATGGAHFVLTLLPADATALDDRPITWSGQDGGVGDYVARLNLPAEPGRYLVAWHRYGETDLQKALARFEIEAAARPEVSLGAPAAVEPGAPVPVEMRGGGAHADRVEIWRDGALVSWDQSAYVEELFDNQYGPAKVLPAPQEPGNYEIVYVFSDMDAAEAVAARLPLTVGDAPAEVQEGALATEAPVQRADAGEAAAPDAEQGTGLAEDVGYACPADNGVPCIFDDEQTGLLFALPPGWFTDFPTRASHVAGDSSTDGPVRLTFYSPASPTPDTVVLNPRQWTTMNGPCISLQAGELCAFEPGSALLEPGLEVLRRGLHDRRPAPRAPAPDPQVALNEAMKTLAGDDPKAAAAMEALLGAAQDAKPGEVPDIGAILGAVLGGAMQDGHGPDNGDADARAWADYPHRCLLGDRTQANCDMRDANSNLAFTLLEPWVAEVLTTGPRPRADFFEAGAGANHIALNPTDWPQRERACAFTRAGTLCADPDIADPALRRAFDMLRFSLTTGEVLRRCGAAPCQFSLPNPPLSGTLPASWSVEVGRRLPDGRIATWFWDMDPGGNLKLIGLNQSGGDNCMEPQAGDHICDFTPYISDGERALIATALILPAPADRQPARDTLRGRPIAPEDLNTVLDIIRGN